VLGRGAFAAARVAVQRSTGQRVAIKSIRKSRLEGLSPEWANARREVEVMYTLTGHPNIPNLLDTFEDNTHVHLVMDLCAGGGLLERVVEKGRYSEPEAAAVMRAVLGAAAYAHEMGCTHRDIKLDNLMYADASGDSSAVRLVDWGFATFLRPGERLKGLCGTSYYVSPEVLSGTYDERADIWSCGVVLYVMLSGRPPFTGRNESVFRKIVDDGVPEM